MNMMNKTNQLALLLAVQLFLVFFFYSRSSTMEAFVPNEPMIALQSSEITKLVVEGMEEDKVTTLELERTGGAWKLPGLDSFPASLSKVQGVLDKLMALKRSLPVANTEIAQRQLKTATGVFERKVTLVQGDKTKIVFLGTSPTFKKVHFRLDGEDSTYTGDLSTYEISLKNEEWIDRNLLAIPRDKISKLSLNDAVIKIDGGAPVTEGLGEGEETNLEKVNGLLSKLGSLSFDSVLNSEEQGKVKEKAADWQFTVERSDNTTDTYSFYKLSEDSGDVVLKVSSHPFFVKAAKSTLEDLKKANKAELSKKKESAAAPRKEETTPSSAESPEGIVPESALEAPEESAVSDAEAAMMEEMPLVEDSADEAPQSVMPE